MELLDSLKNITRRLDNEGCEAQLFLVQRNKTRDSVEFSVYRTIISEDISVLLVKLLYDSLSSMLDSGDFDLVQFIPGYLDDRNVIEYINAKDVLYYNEIIYKVLNNHILDLPEVIDGPLLKNLWAYAVTINCNGEIITYFNKYTQGKILKKSKLLSLFYRDGRFNVIEDDIFTLQKSIDCFSIADNIFIIRRNNFEQIFCQQEHYYNIAIQTLGELGDLLTDVDDLTDACTSDLRKLRKIAAIASSGIYHDLSFDKIKEVIEGYDLAIELDEDNQRIKATKNQIWDLLRLLNDDFLRSPMTEKKYEVHSKKAR